MSDLQQLLQRGAELHQLELDADTCARLQIYIELLQRHGARTNLIGSLESKRIVDELILDSLQLVPLVNEKEFLLDIGSGAGLPGMVLLCAHPEWQATLVEPRMKRARFLSTVKRTLGLKGVEVIEGRIEDLEPQPWTLATARAVFAPEEWTTRACELLTKGARVGLYLNGHDDSALSQLNATQQGHVVCSRAYKTKAGQARTTALVASH